MSKAFALDQAFRRILNTASTLDEATQLYHDAIAEIFPFDFEIEMVAADKQRELIWSNRNVVDKGEKVGA